MNPGLGDAVELLERALGYTRAALGDLDGADLHAPTPCVGWDLARLLAHLEDSLDAFTEAATGAVLVHPAPPLGSRGDVLRAKAGDLLAAWLSGPPERIRVGTASMSAAALVTAAALEVTVHGWDVARATGGHRPIPAGLATSLLGAAPALVSPADRGARFAAARSVPRGSSPDERLLAWLGRAPTTREVTHLSGGHGPPESWRPTGPDS